MHGDPRSASCARRFPLIRPRRVRAAIAIVSAALFAACAGPALASWMIPQVPWRPKDFTIVKKDGLYHLFYIRNNPNLPLAQTQFDLGHATSKDLYFWQQQDSVLEVRPGHFDRHRRPNVNAHGFGRDRSDQGVPPTPRRLSGHDAGGQGVR